MLQNGHAANLKKADEAVFKIIEAVKKAPSRQKYHFMPPAYWMNDPNGLIYFKDTYHLFYQFNPYSPEWGPMHWGHATSKDLLHWQHQPIALAPSEIYDLHERGGCFSGSAVDDNGTLSLMFTAATMSGDSYVQTQCLATSKDAIHFYKYEGNPLVKKPNWLDSEDFRDPKVFKHDYIWYMVVGARNHDHGQALLYRSNDLIKWEFFSVLAESRGELGYMWECPDFFEIGGKYVLFISPIGIGERKTVYLIGDMDFKTGKFNYHSIGEVDWGFDFYAPQTLVDDKNRRITFGWANSWDWMPWWKGFGPTYKDNWCGALSLPRKIELIGENRLKFTPIEEIKELRKDKMHYEQKLLNDGELFEIKAGDGISCELIIDIDLKSTTASSVEIALRASKEYETLVTLNIKNGTMTFDRNRSDDRSEGKRHCTLLSASKDSLRLHIFMDTCSIEIFTDDGATAFSSNIFPKKESNGIYIRSKGGKAFINQADTWGLKSVW